MNRDDGARVARSVDLSVAWAGSWAEFFADPNGRDAYTAVHGTCFALRPGLPNTLLFDCLGAVVSNAAVGDPDTVALRSRQVLLFCDPGTGTPLDRWHNPLNDQTVEVLHDWLDPVNRRVSVVQPQVRSGGTDGSSCFTDTWTDTFSNPLRPDVFAAESDSLVIQQTFSTHTFATPIASSNSVAWTQVRMLPWLPWMLMAGVEGSLVMHLHGTRVDSVAGFAQPVAHVIRSERPEFAFAPTRFDEPSRNSWLDYFALRQPAALRNLPVD